jgi:hypothetical protein
MSYEDDAARALADAEAVSRDALDAARAAEPQIPTDATDLPVGAPDNDDNYENPSDWGSDGWGDDAADGADDTDWD